MLSLEISFLYLRQALFVDSVFTDKPVFVKSMITVKPVFVNSKGLRVFQKNRMCTNFLSFWKMKL